MPSKKSRRVRMHKTQVNKPVRTRARTKVVDARNAIEADANAEETDAKVKEAVSALSIAARKGVIHPNNASRRASRLVKMANTAKSS